MVSCGSLCDVCYCKQYKVNGFATTATATATATVTMALTQTYLFEKFKF